MVMNRKYDEREQKIHNNVGSKLQDRFDKHGITSLKSKPLNLAEVCVLLCVYCFAYPAKQ